MPRTTRARARTLDNSRIELTIPLRMSGRASGGGGGAVDACYICANDFCGDDVCCRSLTHLECCTQTMCCACLARMIKRCKCSDDCEAVIALCPFCREVSPVTVLDVFLGRAAVCKPCLENDEQEDTEDDSDDDESGEPQEPEPSAETSAAET